jgi:Uma2 family endonuclease
MHTPEEIKQAIRQLTSIERRDMTQWLADANDYAVAEPALAYGTDSSTRLLTVDEYLAFEETAGVKHEYVAGVLYAMCGVSKSHNLIGLNLATAFHNHLRGSPCRTCLSDVKLKLKARQDDIFYYPDIMVACGHETASEVFLEQPKLVIEILSPPTERTDRREKALNYRHVDTLEEYVLIAQNRTRIEIQRRAADWQPTVLTSLEDLVEFRSIDFSLSLSKIYEEVSNAWTPPLA